MFDTQGRTRNRTRDVCMYVCMYVCMMCRLYRKNGPAAGLKLHARPWVGTGRRERTGRQSRSARNSAEARVCLAIPRHTEVDGSCIAFPINIFLETAPDAAANSASSLTSAKAGGQHGRTFHGTWDRGTERHAPVPVWLYFHVSVAAIVQTLNHKLVTKE